MGGGQRADGNGALGRWGEQVAAEHLARAGLRVLDRNWRAGRLGELDLVCREGLDLVFVEVKTRSSLAFGSPAEAITPAKAARLRRLGGAWLAAHDDAAVDVRFDLVGVLRAPDGSVEVTHLRGVL